MRSADEDIQVVRAEHAKVKTRPTATPVKPPEDKAVPRAADGKHLRHVPGGRR